MSNDNPADLLHGVPRIAAFLGLTDRQVEAMVASRSIPTFHIGRNVCARKSTLNAFMAEREAEAVKATRSACAGSEPST